MMEGAASVEEARLFHEIAQGMGPLPAGVRRLQFRFGEDSVGDPAVWIVLVADDDLNPSKEKIAALGRFIDEVQAAILRSDTERYPYSQILTEPVNDTPARSA